MITALSPEGIFCPSYKALPPHSTSAHTADASTSYTADAHASAHAHMHTAHRNSAYQHCVLSITEGYMPHIIPTPYHIIARWAIPLHSSQGYTASSLPVQYRRIARRTIPPHSETVSQPIPLHTHRYICTTAGPDRRRVHGLYISEAYT